MPLDIRRTSESRTWVWDAVTLDYVRMEQPVLNAGSVTIPAGITVNSSALPTGAATQTTLASLLTELQLKADLSETQPVNTVQFTVPVIASGQVNTLGNNTLITPAGGKKLRLFYLSYNPLLAVEAAFRFGAAGTLFLRHNITANSVIAKDFGPAVRYIEGAVDDPLILNLSIGVSTNWNALYAEI